MFALLISRTVFFGDVGYLTVTFFIKYPVPNGTGYFHMWTEK